jgi:hypothetical protein
MRINLCLFEMTGLLIKGGGDFPVKLRLQTSVPSIVKHHTSRTSVKTESSIKPRAVPIV